MRFYLSIEDVCLCFLYCSVHWLVLLCVRSFLLRQTRRQMSYAHENSTVEVRG